MAWFPCPYLGTEVELTDERREHIVWRHRNVPRSLARYVSQTLADPDAVRVRSTATDELLFVREFEELSIEPFMVVVVVAGEPRFNEDKARHWIVTAYVETEIPEMGEVQWER